ncbi:hypothetical protein KAR91_75295 [Candidatus Pacearchaeota archaeon]|nr:hypothetical protein [Candidatus Pacearchaeota archaeon]
MAEPNVFWYYNSGSGDATAHGEGSAANDDWTSITVGSENHTLVFTGDGVDDGDGTGERDTVIIPAAGFLEVDKTFIDNGATVEQVPLAGTDQGQQGGGDNQYVFCIYFDGDTASAPYLEMWDDADHDSIALEVLGAGTPADSMVKGIVTTDGAPGSANWVGHPDQIDMAGSGSSDRLDLNTGAAIGSGGGNCYFNICTRIPSTANPFSSAPKTSLRFTYT